MKTIRTVYLQDVVTIIDNDDITSIVVHGKVYDKVKFGKWIGEAEDWRHQIEWFKCSLCDFESSTAYKYCPQCGALMEAENDSAEEC